LLTITKLPAADKIDDIRALLPSSVKETLAKIEGLSAVS
jgi:hypothetical protein